MIEVVVTDPSKVGIKYSIEQDTAVIGRAEGNDIVLECEDVSRYHARISVRDGKLYIQDLDSTNGVFINFKKVSEGEVAPQDKIQLADFTLSMQYVRTEVAVRKRSGTQSFAQDLHQAAEQEKTLVESFEEAFGPIWDLICDETISEVAINAPDEIYIGKRRILHRTDLSLSDEQIQSIVLLLSQYSGKRLSKDEPFLETNLPSGAKISVVLPPFSLKGVTICIRKPTKEKVSLEKLLSAGTVSSEVLMFLEACILLRKNIIISGGIGSGKTSLLNMLVRYIPEEERIVTVEENAELELTQEHVVRLVAPDDRSVNFEEVAKASLGLRPDRLVVGEFQGKEVPTLIQATSEGRFAILGNINSSNPLQALCRLETLFSTATTVLPSLAIREQIASAIDVVVHVACLPDYTRKVTRVAVVGPINGSGSYDLQDIFVYKKQNGHGKGSHVLTGNVPEFLDELETAGLSDVVGLFSR